MKVVWFPNDDSHFLRKKKKALFFSHAFKEHEKNATGVIPRTKLWETQGLYMHHLTWGCHGSKLSRRKNVVNWIWRWKFGIFHKGSMTFSCQLEESQLVLMQTGHLVICKLAILLTEKKTSSHILMQQWTVRSIMGFHRVTFQQG